LKCLEIGELEQMSKNTNKFNFPSVYSGSKERNCFSRIET